MIIHLNGIGYRISLGAFITTTSISIGVSAVIVFVSYLNYLTMVANYNNITQYEEAIQMYDNYIELDLNKVTTDFAYQGHSDNVANLVKDLRNKVVDYNTDLVQKTSFSEKTIIYKPDPVMKTIHIKLNLETKLN